MLTFLTGAPAAQVTPNLFDPSTPTVLLIIISLVIPGISALLAKQHWDKFWMGIISLALASITSFFTEWYNAVDFNHYNWSKMLGMAAFSFVVAVASNLGIWTTTGVTSRLLKIGSKPKPFVPADPPVA